MFFTLACRRSWATRCSTSSCYASSTGLHAHTAIKKTTQGSYPIILLMLSARGRVFSLFNYLRYHCYEICSQFMKVRWNCSTAAFASNECHRNSTVFQNKRAHPQMRNIVSLQKKRCTCHQQSTYSDNSKMQPSPKIKCIGGTQILWKRANREQFNLARGQIQHIDGPCAANFCPQLSHSGIKRFL